MPGLRAGPSCRVVSPSGGSILITSAPRSPSCCAAHGPSTTVVQSRILTPASGPAMYLLHVFCGHLSRDEAVCETWRQPLRNSPHLSHSVPTLCRDLIRLTEKGGCHAHQLDESIGRGV